MNDGVGDRPDTDWRIVVTGAASGIGEGILRAFARRGQQVVGLDVQEAQGARVCAEATAEGPGRADFLRCDISDERSVAQAFDRATGMMGGLEVLVNAAGIVHEAAPEDHSLDDWERMMAVNGRGTFLTNRAAFHWLRGGGGRIVNFTSPVAALGSRNKAAYAAAKSAVLGWTRSCALSWGQYGITVNAVAPVMLTPMYRLSTAEATPEEVAARDSARAQAIPMGGRWGDVEQDLVPLILFLAGAGSRYMTGQLFSCSGGALMAR